MISRIGRSGQLASPFAWACAKLTAATTTRTATSNPEAARVIETLPRVDSHRIFRATDMPRSLFDALRLAEALDQRGAQQEGARELRIFRGSPQLVVVFLPHRRILLHQHALVADGLRLRVLDRD